MINSSPSIDIVQDFKGISETAEGWDYIFQNIIRPIGQDMKIGTMRVHIEIKIYSEKGETKENG